MAHSHYIFTVASPSGESLRVRDVLEARLDEGFWPLNKKTPHQKNLRRGDRILFYGTGAHDPNGQAFLAEGKVLGELERIRRTAGQERAWLGTLNRTRLQVPVGKADWFEAPVPIRPLLDDLSFIKNAQFWGAHLMGGITKIPQQDYDLVMRQAD